MVERFPRIGDIVWYILDGDCGERKGAVRPAIVTQVFGSPEQGCLLNLNVQLSYGDHSKPVLQKWRVNEDSHGLSGTWHWPPPRKNEEEVRIDT